MRFAFGLLCYSESQQYFTMELSTTNANYLRECKIREISVWCILRTTLKRSLKISRLWTFQWHLFFFSGLYTTIWITQCFFGLENFVVSRRFDWKHQTEFEDVLISIHMGLKIKLWAKLSYDNPKQRTCPPDGYYIPRRSYRVILSCLKDTFRYDSSRLFPGDLQTFEICVWMPNWITRESVISKSGSNKKQMQSCTLIT